MLQYLLSSHLNNQFHIEMQVMAFYMFQIDAKNSIHFRFPELQKLLGFF